AKANNWTSERVLEIVGGFLEGMIAVWYKDTDFQKDLHVRPLEISQQEIFDQFIEDNKDICALSQTKIGHTTLFQHQIPTGDHEPII
ncbi:3545_t:CDS:2, partial [Funneliformis geosporum]